MIHYHGTPVGGRSEDAARFLSGRHALISFARPSDIGVAAEVSRSFVLDNGAFTTWKKGVRFDRESYYKWVEKWYKHPGCDWSVIPDIIGGSEKENDAEIARWPFGGHGVPVWHLHESVERLQRLSEQWAIVALGSSGDYSSPNTAAWWKRINEAMGSICDEHGRPNCNPQRTTINGPPANANLFN